MILSKNVSGEQGQRKLKSDMIQQKVDKSNFNIKTNNIGGEQMNDDRGISPMSNTSLRLGANPTYMQTSGKGDNVH